MLKVVFNGQLIDAAAAAVSPLAAGFSHGFGVFDTMRAEQGRVLFVKEHLARLYASCDALDLGPLPTQEEMIGHLKRVLEVNNLDDCVLKIHVARGGVGIDYVVFVREPHAPERHPASSFRVLIDRDSAPSKWIAGHKCANYLRNLLARAYAQTEGFDEVIFVAPDNRVLEGAGTNVFWVIGGVIHTPSLECPILPGVMRKLVVERQQVAPVREGSYSLADFERAEEVFLTNATRGVVPVSVVEGASVRLSARRGPVTAAVQAAIAALEA